MITIRQAANVSLSSFPEVFTMGELLGERVEIYLSLVSDWVTRLVIVAMKQYYSQ